MAQSKRRGAPRKAAKERKEAHVTVWVTAEQKALIERAAAAEDEDKTGNWLRKVGLRAARERLGLPPPEPKG